MNKKESIGGVGIKEVISFQTQIMMGAQFGRVVKAKAKDDIKDEDKKDIVIACLRMGWNDAFRHTSENVKKEFENKKGERVTKSILDIKSEEWNKNHKNEYDDFICDKILSTDYLLNTFYDFTTARKSEDKVKVVENNFDKLKKLFSAYKKTDGEKALCFGHFQKMFNIALKLYLCLYMCREYLELDDELFYDDIIESLSYADCPIDSIIIDKLAEASDFKKFTWSKLGAEEKTPTDIYIYAQETIRKIQDASDKSNLYYDFFAWKK